MKPQQHKRHNIKSQPQTEAARLAAERATVADLEALRERLARELQGKPGEAQAIERIDLQIAVHAEAIAKLEAQLIFARHGTY